MTYSNVHKKQQREQLSLLFFLRSGRSSFRNKNANDPTLKFPFENFVLKLLHLKLEQLGPIVMSNRIPVKLRLNNLIQIDLSYQNPRFVK